ncbi:hypothetical protein PPACK8108_LOCUS23334, partial [Phakopsora pachyrhizi]
GNINAALDGAGDVIANRKRLTVTSRSTEASATKSAPTANATAPTKATAPAPATSTELSTVTPPVAAVDAAQTNAEPAGAKKQNSVRQAVNSSLKQTVTLVQRVTGKLCSKANQTIDSFGNSISQRKQQASKRFSR